MKRALIVIILVAMIFVASGCVYNKQLIDTAQGFDYAYIGMPDGSVIEGKVQNWTDFEDGDQIQVKINGTYYFTHSSNVVLIKK